MTPLISQLIIISILLQLLLPSTVLAETINMQYSDPNHLHAPYQVTVDGQQTTYQYDANGNLTNDGERTIEWNQDNLPVKITKGDSEIRFFYDASGRRVVKEVVGGEKTIYVNQYLTIEQLNNETIYQKYYFAQGRRIAQRVINNNNNLTIQQFSNLYFLHHDYLGSTILTTDLNSQPSSNSLSYFPYGSSVNNLTIQQFSNYLFTGQEKDPESDLYNYNARLYNPRTGVFISADTVGGDNRYAYAKNNPMLFTDPTGHMDWVGDGGGGGEPYLPMIIKDYYNGPWIGTLPAEQMSETIPLWVVDYFLSGQAADNWMLEGNSSLSEVYQYYRNTKYRGEPVYQKMYGSFANYVAHEEMMYRTTMLAAGMTAPLKTPKLLGPGPQPAGFLEAGKKPVIYWVDDNPDEIVDIADHLQEKHGVRVRLFRSADETMDVIIRQGYPDLLVTDVALPGELTSADLLETVNSMSPKTPLAVFSGWNFDAQYRIMRPPKEGVNFTFFWKPMRLGDIWPALRKLLGR
jgi:RHS repeat-associated protein